MKNNIIENIEFDTKVTDNFYVIKDKAKQEKNSDFIKEHFNFATLEEGSFFGYIRFTLENNTYLSFTNRDGFQLDFIILNMTIISQKVKKYLLDNVDMEISKMIRDVYANSISL